MTVIAATSLFSAPQDDVGVDLCFIIDRSGSSTDNNILPGKFLDRWELKLQFLSELVNSFNVAPSATRVGAVVFSEQANLLFALNTYSDVISVKDAIGAIPKIGATKNTDFGFQTVKEQCFSAENGDRPNAPNLAVFVSDGLPCRSDRRNIAIREVEALQNEGVSVVMLAVQ